MPRLLPTTPETVAAKQAIAKARQRAWRPRSWARDVDISISSVWDLIGSGELDVIRLGSSMTLILTSPETWLHNKLEQQKAAGDAPLPKIRRTRDLSPEERAKHPPGPTRGNLRGLRLAANNG